MNYKQILPPDHLRDYIRYFGILESEPTDSSSQTFKIITDGCPGMIFQENANSFTHINNKHLPQLFIHGLFTKHSEKTADGQFNNVGVYFHPTALKTIFGLEAHELTNGYLDFKLLYKEDLISKLMNVSSPTKRIDILVEFVTKLIERNKFKETNKLNHIVNFIKRNVTIHGMQQLQDDLNLSERTLERLFKSGIGISPKLFSRIIRFQSSLNAIRNHNFYKLTDVAYDFYYSDQSHYLREFKEFAGTSPKKFIKQAHEQAENFPEWKS